MPQEPEVVQGGEGKGPRARASLSWWLAGFTLLAGAVAAVAGAPYGDSATPYGAEATGRFVALVGLHSGLYAAHALWRRRLSAVVITALQAGLVILLGVTSRNPQLVLMLSVGLVAFAVAAGRERWGLATILTGGVLLFSATVGMIDGARAAVMAILSFGMIGLLVAAVQRARGEAGRRRVDALLAELDAAHHELAGYAAAADRTARQGERQRLARELHDTLAQGLVGLTLQLEAADSHLARAGTERAQQIIQDAMARARSTLAEARGAIDGLRTVTLPEGGSFRDAVEREALRFRDATSLPCEIAWRVDVDPPAVIRHHTLGVLREALSNVAQHARASSASVRVEGDGAAVVVRVTDDGVGFDPASSRAAGHYGLLGVAERARLTGGTARVEAAPGEGTTVTVRLGRNNGAAE